MDIEMGDIVCSGGNTKFQIFAGSRKYLFTVPNEAIKDFLGDDTVDCPRYVQENEETFKQMAAGAIERNPEQFEFLIGYQAIVDNFY